MGALLPQYLFRLFKLVVLL